MIEKIYVIGAIFLLLGLSGCISDDNGDNGNGNGCEEISAVYEYNDVSRSSAQMISGDLHKAQSFTIGTVSNNIETTLNSIEINAEKLNNGAGRCTITIRDSLDGTVYATGSFETRTLKLLEFDWITVDMTEMILKPGNSYFICIKNNVWNNGFYIGSSDNSYVGGKAWTRTHDGTWYALNEDLLFRIHASNICS